MNKTKMKAIVAKTVDYCIREREISIQYFKVKCQAKKTNEMN